MKQILRSLGSFWGKCFDYRGAADKKEYWIPVAGFLLLAAAAFAALFLEIKTGSSTLPGIILTVLAGISLVPLVSLTVRRLHSVERSGFWAFLMLAVGVGFVALLVLCSLPGRFNPIGNTPVCVYGPPEWFESEYDPKNNENVDVYGPPEWFESKYDPKNNENAPVYGPPEWFENKGEQKP